MADVCTGRSTSPRNSDVCLGLVGVPSTQESIQTADDFIFDFDPSVDTSAENEAAVDAHVNAFYAEPGLPDGQLMNDLQLTTNSALTTYFEPSALSQPYIANEQCLPNTYDATCLDFFPFQQTFTYPEPQDYFSVHETPYFNNGYGAFEPAEDIYGMGLTALPGSNAFVDYGNAQYSSQQYANSIESWMMPTEIMPLSMVQSGYPYVNDSTYDNTSMQLATCPERPPASTTTSNLTNGPPPSSAVKKVTKEDVFDSDTNSDEDYREVKVKTKKTSKRAVRKKICEDSVSSAGTSAASPDQPAKYVPGEKPQKVDTKPWIRTNANTEGDTRTAKINHWKNQYKYKPLPLGAWTSGKHTFKYTHYENVDFLTEAPMSTRKIKEYIMNYPNDDQKHLVLWIQKVPADQGRRYGSKQHSKCVFRDCPMQRYVEGTISTGEYRIAFDEKHFTYGKHVDPYDCTAFAHLYCMEQFLDFEQVCQTVDVRVDTRVDMPLEPNGRAAFSMVDVPSRHEMERFVQAASKGKLRQTKRWNNYPSHADYNRDEQKPHERTLTYLAHCMYEAHQDDSHKKQAALRKVTVSQRRVHLGDLEMSVADKRIMIEVYGGKKRGRKAKIEDHYDEHIIYHIARAEREAMNFLEAKCQGKKSAKIGKKRRLVESADADDEQSVNESPYRFKRAVRHKKQRVKYAESPSDTQHQYAQASRIPSQPLQSIPTPEQQVQHLEDYVATTIGQTSEPAHVQPPIDPTLETPYGLYAVPVTPKYDISDFSTVPICESDSPDDKLEKLLALERRQSCMEGFSKKSCLKSPNHGRGTPRPAGFAWFEARPVCDSEEYRVSDPPSLVSIRRSARLARKEKIDERQVNILTRSSR